MRASTLPSITTITLAASMLMFAAPRAAGAQDFEQTAEVWGRMHGAAIYCHVTEAHDFGVRAMAYFSRKVGAGARMEALREKYGSMFLANTRKPPSGAAGSSCADLREKMNAALAEMSR